MNNLIWNGKRLGNGPVALQLIAAGGSTGTLPTLIVATAAAASHSVTIRPEAVGRFLLSHADCVVACGDAGVFHALLESEFLRGGEHEALGALWSLAKTGRLVDVLLLHDLVQMAGADFSVETSTLPEVIHRQCGLIVDEPKNLADEVIRSGAHDVADLDDQLIERATAIATGVSRTYESLQMKAQHAASTNAVSQETFDRHGPLSLTLQVQGAIAMAHAKHNALAIEPDRLRGVVDELQMFQQRCCERLAKDSKARHCFRIKHGTIDLRDHLPKIKQDQLQKWLHDELEVLAGPYGLPLPSPHASRRHASTVSEAWGILGECHPTISVWCRLHAVARALQILDHSTDNRLPIRYAGLPRLTSTPPQAVLKQLVGKGLFRPPSRCAFLVVRFLDLELRALAAVCQGRDGHSALADAFRSREDVVAMAGNHLASANPRISVAVNEIDAADLWRQIADALMTAMGLKLGTGNARGLLLGRFGLRLSPSDVEQLVAALYALFPELEVYARDDTLQTLAWWLDVDVQICQRELSAYTPTDIRRAISGYRGDPKVFQRIVQIDQEQGHGAMPLQSGGDTLLYEQVFGKTVCTRTGRVRSQCLFSEETAEHLDLADDAVKAALFAIVANGYQLVAYVEPEAVIAIPLDHPDKTSKRIVELAQDAAGAVLGDVPVCCEPRIGDRW